MNGYERNALFHGRGEAGFASVAYLCGADRVEDGRSVGVSDLDSDGDLDLVLQNYNMESCLLINQHQTGNWLRLRLHGVVSNRDAIGSRVLIRHGERRQTREVQCGSGYLACQTLAVHFGLGDSSRIDRLDIYWPSGRHQVLEDIGVNQQLELVEPSNHAEALTNPGSAPPSNP